MGRDQPGPVPRPPRCAHVFHVVKRLWGFAKVGYRGIAKNTTRALTTFALANLYLVRHTLRPQGT